MNTISAARHGSLKPVDPIWTAIRDEATEAVERDPLLALIQDKEQAEQKAAQTVQDALGEFIGGLRRPPADADRSDTRVATRTPPRPADKDTKPAARPEPRPTAERLEPIEPPPAATDATQRLVIVALDAGHGGEDPGAVGPSGL